MTTVLDDLKRKLADNPAGILENIAKEHQVCLADAIKCLPADMWRELSGDHFERVIKEVPDWGQVTTIANTGDMIFEVSGDFPKGTFARGYYNLKKTQGGFSGHIKEDACHSILFLKRPFFSKLSASINFINEQGNCYLKIFLGRDEGGELRADQLEKFHALSNWEH